MCRAKDGYARPTLPRVANRTWYVLPPPAGRINRAGTRDLDLAVQDADGRDAGRSCHVSQDPRLGVEVPAQVDHDSLVGVLIVQS